MTTEEAVKELSVEYLGDSEKIKEAKRIAIKALEQEPCEDCISRQKMGRWITWKEAGNEIPSETRFECSVCYDTAQTLCNGLDLLSSFCPNCGARMVESEEEE